MPPASVAVGGCLPGGCLSRGCLSMGGMSAYRGCLPRGRLPWGCLRGGVCPGGDCLRGICPEGLSARRGLARGCLLRGFTPPMNRITDKCKNITLPQTSFEVARPKHFNMLGGAKQSPLSIIANMVVICLHFKIMKSGLIEV